MSVVATRPAASRSDLCARLTRRGLSPSRLVVHLPDRSNRRFSPESRRYGVGRSAMRDRAAARSAREGHGEGRGSTSGASGAVICSGGRASSRSRRSRDSGRPSRAESPAQEIEQGGRCAARPPCLFSTLRGNSLRRDFLWHRLHRRVRSGARSPRPDGSYPPGWGTTRRARRGARAPRDATIPRACAAGSSRESELCARR